MGTSFSSGLASAGLVVGLDGLRGLFQFCDSMFGDSHCPWGTHKRFGTNLPTDQHWHNPGKGIRTFLWNVHRGGMPRTLLHLPALLSFASSGDK